MQASPSALKDADKCFRKWAFRRFGKIERQDQPWFKFGRDLDAHAERYLLTGIRPPWGDPAGDLFCRGIPLLPAPGLAATQVPLVYEIAGHTIKGYADFVYTDGQWIILGDHKTFGNKKYNLTVSTLPEDAQAVGYGGALLQRFDLERIKARWIYYDKRNADAYPVEIVIDRKANEATTRRKFLPLLDAMQTMCEISPTTIAEINKIPNDPSACDGCGKFCDYATQCNLY